MLTAFDIFYFTVASFFLSPRAGSCPWPPMETSSVCHFPMCTFQLIDFFIKLDTPTLKKKKKRPRKKKKKPYSMNKGIQFLRTINFKSIWPGRGTIKIYRKWLRSTPQYPLQLVTAGPVGPSTLCIHTTAERLQEMHKWISLPPVNVRESRPAVTCPRPRFKSALELGITIPKSFCFPGSGATR